jgi:glycosyltransferase involved in cell wall biosynthesis
LADEELPKISVITLLYNRKAFIELAFKNILATDYPKDKIEWIVIEDSDNPAEDASDRVVAVAESAAP